MTKLSVHAGQSHDRSSFGDRLLFVIWLAGKVLGVDNGKQFAAAIGKGPSQLSRWLNEDPRPNWETIKAIADSVKISAVWLDDPSRADATEPPDFAEWLRARRQRAKGRRASGER